MRKLEIIFSLIFLVINFCHGQENINSRKKNVRIDTSMIAILPFNENTQRKFKNCSTAELNNQEILLAEKLLLKRITEYNKQEKINPSVHTGYRYIKLKKYHRQYVAAINSKGEKEVFINCFCESAANEWKEVLNEVDDGGNCFFSLKINLTLNSTEELDINGP